MLTEWALACRQCRGRRFRAWAAAGGAAGVTHFIDITSSVPNVTLGAGGDGGGIVNPAVRYCAGGLPNISGSAPRPICQESRSIQVGKLLAIVRTPIRPPFRDRKFADSLLEGDGFELVVPRHDSP